MNTKHIKKLSNIKQIILFIGFFLLVNSLHSQITQTYTTAGSFTWVCPPNVTSVQVQCWGAGGGGGNSGNNTINGGHGGGGGSFSQSTLNVTPGMTYYLKVGIGGNGGPAYSNASAADGEDSWFNPTNTIPTNNNGVLAKGGKKGPNNTTANIINKGDSLFGFGSIKFSGGNGLGGYSSGGQGGGSSAGYFSVGVNATSIVGAIAPVGGGNGGAGSSTTTTNGQSGLIPGGGGGGSDDWQARSGGNGANGQIVLSYTPNCAGFPELGLVTLFPNSGCGTTQLNAYLLSNEPGISYQWQSSIDQVTWSNISNANSSSLVATSSISTYYRIRSICQYGDTSYSNSVFYQYTTNPAQPSPISNTPTIECGQTANLLAGAGGTSDYAWFSDPNGLNQVGTGNTYTTPPLNTTTNYYVASTYLPQLQQTYLIPASDLVNLTFDCGTGSIYGTGIVGFNWTDVLPSNVNITSVTADLSIGTECTPGSKTTTLNSINQPSFTTTANCSCSGNSFQSLNLAPANYIKNGVNQFRVTNASSFGFNSTNATFSGSFAKITVNYSLSSPCYSDLTQVPITIIPSSSAGTISSTQTICAGDTPQSLTFSGISGSIQWQSSLDSLLWTDIPGATSTTISSLQIGALTATKYYRVVVSNTGCSPANTSGIKITVNPLPIVNAGIDQNVCASSLVTLNGSGANNYTWNNGVFDNTPFSILTTTTYTVVGTDGNGCQNSDQVLINVTPQSLGGTASSNQSFCFNGTPTALTLSGYLGAIQWQSSTNNLTWTNISGATSTTLSSPQMGLLSQTTYFRALVTNGICPGIESNVVTITIYPNSVAGIAGPSQIICSGTLPSPITLSGYTGTIQWYSGTSSTGPWTLLNGSTSNVLSSAEMGILNATKYYRATITSGNCASVTSNVVMINVTPASVGGTISSSQTVCSGSSVNLTATGYTGTLQWQLSSDNITFTDIPGATSASYPTGSLSQTTYYRVAVTNSFCATAYSTVATITTNSINAGSIATNQTICNGTSPSPLTFSSLPIGSGTLSYVWQYSLNGISSWINVPGGTSATLTSAQMGTLSAARYYRVYVISTLNGVACGSYSNVISVIINTILSGTIGSDQTFCFSGDALPINFITPSTGSGVLTYQWQSSNDNIAWSDLSGEINSSFDPPVNTATKYYRVITFSTLNGTTCNSTSSVIAVYVNFVNSGLMGSNQTICSGTSPATFTSSTADGLGTLTYSWESSLDNTTWTSISGATSANYTAGVLFQNTYFRRLVNSTYNGVVCSQYTNTTLITINQIGTASIGSPQTICSGETPQSLTITNNPTSNGTLSYQWQYSTNGTTWVAIPGATSNSLSPVQMGSLTASRYYRLILTNTLNSVSCSSTSNSILITINSVASGTIAGTQTVCFGGDPATFTSSVAGSGSGTLTYQWQSSIDGTTWSNISLANALTYNAPAPLNATTYYRRQVTSTLSGVPCTATSNVLTVFVNTISSGLIGSDQTVCVGGDPATLTFTSPPIGAGTLSYQWQSSLNGTTWTAVAATPTYNPPVGISNTTYYRVNVTSTLNSVGCIATSNTVTVTVNSVLPGTIGNDQVFCSAGDPVPFSFISASSGSGTLTYQWQSSLDDFVWNTINGQTSIGFDPLLIDTTTYFNAIVTSNLNGVNCSSSTNSSIVYINTPFPGVIGNNQTICSGTTPSAFSTITAATGIGTPSYQWQSSIDNINWTNILGATGSVYSPTTPALTTYYRRVVSYNLNSVICSATSNTITITVNQVSAGTIGSNQTICSGGDPDALVLSVPASGSGTLSYQWQSSINGTTWTNISGATLPSYDIPTGQTALKYYRLIVTSFLNGSNCSSTSNTVTISINNVTSGTIAGNQTICIGGDPNAFTSSASGTTNGALFYQWQSSLDNLNWSNISGATALTYNVPSPLNTTIYYRRQAISVLNGMQCYAYTNVVTVTVNSVNAGIIGNDQTICSGGDPLPFEYSPIPTGSGILSYDWQSSADNLNWTSISSSMIFNPPVGQTNNTYFHVIVSSNLNNVICNSTSNSASIVINNVNAGTIGSNQTICAADDPAPIIFQTGGSASGSLGYQWFNSADNVNWNTIIGATQNSYDPSVLSSNTYYKVIVSSTVTPPIYSDSLVCQATTNTVLISLNTFTPGTIGSSQSICSGGDPATFIVTSATSGSGTFAYQWQSSPDGLTWTNIATTTSTYNVPAGLTVSKYYRRLTSHTYLGITCTLPTNVLFVGVYNAGTVSSSQSICTGAQPTDLSVTGAIGSIQWQTSTNGTTWANIAGATNTVLTSAQMAVTSTNKYFRVTINGTCSPTLSSNSILITVLASPTINAGLDQPICSGGSIILSASGGLNYVWNNGVINNQSFIPTSTTTYTVTGTASNGCTGTDQITITVNPTPTVSIINNNPVVICQGQVYTLNSQVTNGSSYQWKRNGINISGATGPNYSTMNNSGAYTLTVTSSNGCVATSGAVTINITPLPTISAGPDQHICIGDSVVVNATSATPFTWSGGIQNGVYFTPNNSNSYVASTVNSSGCVGTDSVTIFIHYPVSSFIYASSIGSYFLNGTEYSQTGTYQQTINSVYGCDSTITLSLTVYSVGIEENIGDQIRFYPNPSQDGIFYFEMDGFIQTMNCVIYNSLGQLIESYQTIPTTIDLSKREPGVYFIELSNSEFKYVIKTVKKGN